MMKSNKRFFRNITTLSLVVAMSGFYSTANATATATATPTIDGWTAQGDNTVKVGGRNKTIVSFKEVGAVFIDFDNVNFDSDDDNEDLKFNIDIRNLAVTPHITQVGFRFDNVDLDDDVDDIAQGIKNTLKFQGFPAGSAPSITPKPVEYSETDGYLQLWFDIGTNPRFEPSSILNLNYDWEDFALKDPSKGGFSLNIGISTLGSPEPDLISNVPVPAAVWFFATGLAGLFLNSRKK